MIDKELKLAKDLALMAGSIIRKNFELPKNLHLKKDGTPLTGTDLEISDLVLRVLSKKSPYDVIGEEKSNISYGERDIFWICDPVDGTKALVDGIPTAMFSLALIKEAQPVIAVAYDPFLKLLYWAVNGKGSYCNDRKLKVSINNLAQQSVGIASDAKQILDNIKVIRGLVESNIGHTTSIEGAVYKSCLVARGRLVGYVSDRAKIHDIAAASLIIKEAGGRVSSLSGDVLDFSRPFSGFVASNSIVHEDLIRICCS